jgi:hypothetical protein
LTPAGWGKYVTWWGGCSRKNCGFCIPQAKLRVLAHELIITYFPADSFSLLSLGRISTSSTKLCSNFKNAFLHKSITQLCTSLIWMTKYASMPPQKIFSYVLKFDSNFVSLSSIVLVTLSLKWNFRHVKKLSGFSHRNYLSNDINFCVLYVKSYLAPRDLSSNFIFKFWLSENVLLI